MQILFFQMVWNHRVLGSARSIKQDYKTKYLVTGDWSQSMFVASPLTHFYKRTYIEIKGIWKGHFIIILQFLKRLFNWFLIATLVTHLNCLNVLISKTQNI